jgi:glycerate-2-kinase
MDILPMRLIKNFHDLASTTNRKIVLEILEAGLSAIQPEIVVRKKFAIHGNILTISEHQYDLRQYENVYLLGFGKGSAGISKQIEKILGDKLKKGFVIDTSSEHFTRKIEFTLGTHPLPSKQNYHFTQKVIHEYSNLSDKDLVLVIICGGGSAMLVSPTEGVSLDEKIAVNKALLKSGANITEMNTVRKHLSAIKGGGLAKILYPATVASLIFSDVPGNDLAFIASGPTVKDTTKISHVKHLIDQYKLADTLSSTLKKLIETPKEQKYFTKVRNILMLSNLSALQAMKKEAEKHGMNARVFSDTFQGEARTVGRELISRTRLGEVLLIGGETTVKVTGNGIGGRNQHVVISSVPLIENEKITIASIASDGWDNSEHAGAIADYTTLDKEMKENLDPYTYINNNDSYTYFEKIGDGIQTGRLPSNVSDLMVVLKK